jgi:transketolase
MSNTNRRSKISGRRNNLMAEISQREAYGRALAAYGGINPRIVAVDADTSTSTFSSFFAEKFPDRFFNTGIAEPCLVDVAVGLALGGLIPFANAFAALLSLRALEQVRTCVCYARTNVKLAASYAGLSDFKDGPTHFATKDIAIMRTLPEMTIIVPADATEVAAWVPIVAEYDGPVYLRLSRAATLPVHKESPLLTIGKGLVLHPGHDITIIATGSMLGRSLKAAREIANIGISARVIEIHTIKPLDVDLICQAAAETGAVVTAEEHTIIGGLGGAVAETLSENCPVPMVRVGIHDTFALTAKDADSLMDAYELAVSDIVKAVEKVLTKK